MRLEILRLGSIVLRGVGGPGAGSIGYIYSMLLQQYDMGIYGFININHIGDEDDPTEGIWKEGRKIDINIRYPVIEDFKHLPEAEQHLMRLNVIHEALLRIADHDKKLDKDKLVIIRQNIIDNHFNFFFTYKKVIHRKHPHLTAAIVINPHLRAFKIFVVITDGDVEIAKIEIFQGQPLTFILPQLFSRIRWKGEHDIIVTDAGGQSAFHINIPDRTVSLVNLTKYDVPPLIQIHSVHSSDAERKEGFTHHKWDLWGMGKK